MRQVIFRYRRRVRFGETDPFGVLYFASMLNYFKEAADEFIRHRGEDPEKIYRNQEKGFGFPVVRVDADYIRPVRYDEELEIEVEVESVRRRAVTLRFNVTREGTFVATGTMSFVSISSSSWKSIPLPEEIRRIFAPPE
ncbi:MAG: hypothetical protein D6713_01455 [Deltaproteobacteria bacterium]|nr:MAG: hypothetical protein D6713_01455 [Deltaproteobacteria bacterium]